MPIPSQLLDRLLERQHPLRTARVLTGLSLRDVEQASGVSKSQLARIERYETTATPAEETAIAAALGLERADLFLVTRNGTPPSGVREPDIKPEPPMTPERQEAFDAALHWIERKGRHLVSGETDDERLEVLTHELAFESFGETVLAELMPNDGRRLQEAAVFLGAGKLSSPQRRAAVYAARFVRPAEEGGEDGWKFTDAEIRRQLEAAPIGDLLAFPDLLSERGDDQRSVWDVLPNDEREHVLALAGKWREVASDHAEESKPRRR